MDENFFRFSAIAIFLTGAWISIYHRHKADRESGEKISPKSEGLFIMIALRFFGFALWLGVLAYLINPAWMAWAQLDLPLWVRWAGMSFGVVSVLFSYWVFSHLGNNVSPSVATRQGHQLVTTGPYRRMRHPLYSMGMLSYLSFAMLSTNWLIAALAIIVFIVLNVRLPQEEAHLIEKFGDEYREYMKQTGKFIPKII